MTRGGAHCSSSSEMYKIYIKVGSVCCVHIFPHHIHIENYAHISYRFSTRSLFLVTYAFYRRKEFVRKIFVMHKRLSDLRGGKEKKY